ncbi:hypothetical protein DFJ63DRAFT_58055 [Scheffersomyces coipomensis]|uniref:uncharacterized protein n=1 Tax=Scheffersomyces coipomensis TaxID=1788519 RepID=UPI00315D46EC
MSVRSFLTTLRSKIDSKTLKVPYSFVTGNQSADLDSVISAISYSYLDNVYDNTSFIIPLVNIPKKDLKLRRDIELLLKSHSIDEDLLYFVEDFELLNAKAPITQIALVDHCNIQGDILTRFLNENRLKVNAIIDHHDDEKVFLDATPRIIHSNGSCSALVFKYWYEKLHESALKEHSEILELLLGPLLIDTSNMTQKVEDGDAFAWSEYKKLLSFQSDSYITKVIKTDTATTEDDVFGEFYSALKTAKKDLTGFTFEDVMLKDYKQFLFSSNETVGFSSIGKSIKWIFKTYSEDEIESTLSKFLKDNKLDLLVITSSYTQKHTGIYTREFCYYYEVKGNSKFDHLSELAQEELQLNSDVHGLEKIEKKLNKVKELKGVFKVYNQVNIKASRKQVVPIVKSILEKDN